MIVCGMRPGNNGLAETTIFLFLVTSINPMTGIFAKNVLSGEIAEDQRIFFASLSKVSTSKNPMWTFVISPFLLMKNVVGID